LYLQIFYRRKIKIFVGSYYDEIHDTEIYAGGRAFHYSRHPKQIQSASNSLMVGAFMPVFQTCFKNV
jgi:hypothetical protein